MQQPRDRQGRPHDPERGPDAGRGGAGRVLLRALAYLRRHGPRQTLNRIIARLSHGSQDFIITRVGLGGPPAPDRVGDVVLRLATPSDLPRLEELERFEHRASVLHRHVHDGDWLFVACDGERIVAARIVMRALPAHELASRVLRLRPEQAWDEDMFCAAEYRGKGIARQLSLFSDRFMHSLGYTEAFARISTANIPSLRMQLHKGSEFAYHVSYRRFLLYKHLRVSRQIPGGKPGSGIIASLPSWREPSGGANAAGSTSAGLDP